jgi:hypothetical protein
MKILSTFALLLLALTGTAAAAEASRDAARAAVARCAPALVTVRMTLKTRVVYDGREGQEYEGALEVQGTVIAPDGLTVVSDLTTHPESMGGRSSSTQVESEATEVKLVLRDGQELPARFVLRDPDLDLAFLAPLAPQTSMPYVKLEKGAVPAPLDDVLLLGQLGPALGREVAAAPAPIRAVVKKPRTFLVPGLVDGLLAVGGPALDDRGRAIGLVVFRRMPGGASRPQGFRDYLGSMQTVVITAADVQDVAAQAIAARAAMAKDEPSPP